MEPIISPWILYAISVSDAMRGVCGVLGCILAVFTVLAFIAIFDSEDPVDDLHKKIAKRLFITSLILILLAIILPSQHTGYRMLAASLITPDNIAGAEDHVIEVIDRLAGIIADKMKN